MHGNLPDQGVENPLLHGGVGRFAELRVQAQDAAVVRRDKAKNGVGVCRHGAVVCKQSCKGEAGASWEASATPKSEA